MKIFAIANLRELEHHALRPIESEHIDCRAPPGRFKPPASVRPFNMLTDRGLSLGQIAQTKERRPHRS
ncbi:hypothetical protein [Sphingopyxis sp. MSC1_008]|uniref:hypothetical protein n=1 Tax=Sphingopyxis sp. MSC1_008 TaxID=2909265 RepID=UPI0020BE4D50|nr:hypothetical protein [Sphingopyxis sp. MSC1_008]